MSGSCSAVHTRRCGTILWHRLDQQTLPARPFAGHLRGPRSGSTRLSRDVDPNPSHDNPPLLITRERERRSRRLMARSHAQCTAFKTPHLSGLQLRGMGKVKVWLSKSNHGSTPTGWQPGILACQLKMAIQQPAVPRRQRGARFKGRGLGVKTRRQPFRLPQWLGRSRP